MKRIASLLILVSLFYNVLGFYLIINYQEEQAWVQSMNNIPDSSYSVIKLNASLYSFIEDSDFEFVNENVTVNNKTYHIFKKRIKDNVLSLYYLRNKHQEKIGKDLNDIVNSQLFNNTSQKNAPIKKLLKSTIKDYLTGTFSEPQLNLFLNLNRSETTTAYNQYIPNYCIKLDTPPPKTA